MQNAFNWMDGSKFDFSSWKNQNTPQPSNTSRQCFVQEMSTGSAGDWVLSGCDVEHVFSCKIIKQNVSHEGFIGECAEGWEKFKGKCYKYFDDDKMKRSWSTANDKCRSFGGSLVTIDNSDVQAKMEIMVRDGKATPVWTGSLEILCFKSYSTRIFVMWNKTCLLDGCLTTERLKRTSLQVEE